MTEIYLHIVARMSDYMATHPEDGENEWRAERGGDSSRTNTGGRPLGKSVVVRPLAVMRAAVALVVRGGERVFAAAMSCRREQSSAAAACTGREAHKQRLNKD